jgi:adenylate cyclase
LFLLGPFRAERAGKPLNAFKSDRVRALLAYLAVERNKAHHRDVLAGLLWPQSDNALALLRDVLSNLRHVLGDRDAETPVIAVTRNTLQINPSALEEATLWMDVVAFSRLIEGASSEAELERAVALYRGDLLEGFAPPDSPEFEVWALLRREAFHRRALDALYRLTTRYLQRGDYAAAETAARRQLALDPYSEEANRQLMRALALAGQRNEALAHYLDYRALLDESLGVAPDVRTTALYQRVRDHQLQPATISPPFLPVDTPSPLAPDANVKPFVGRTSEIAWLETRLEQVQRGQGQTVFVSGEAGSGKTTLVQAFTHFVVMRGEGAVFAGGACNAQIGTGDPYLPFTEILRMLSGDFDVPTVDGALPPAHTQRLETFAPTFTRVLIEEGPDLIGRLVPTSSELIDLPTRKSTGTAGRASLSSAAVCDQVTRVLRTAANQRVLVLVLDDLQWADSGTLNLLAHLARRLAGTRILLIGIYRSVGIDPDDALLSIVREIQSAHGEVILNLDQAKGRDFVDALVDTTPNTLDEAFRAQLTQQTGGHALFTTALLEQMRDDGALVQDDEGRWRASAELDWSRMPPRVEAVIARRLARLTEAQRQLLVVASVEGEGFTAEVTARVLEQKLEDVEHKLRALGEGALYGPHHHLVHGLGLKRIGDRHASASHSAARYRFRHTLFQQYLYTHLDPAQRTRLHEATGRALETLYSDDLDAVAAQLAYHFESAGLIDPAVDYLLQAGKRAYRLSAPVESATLYRKGLALLEQLPESHRRDRREMEILLNLEEALMTTRGWGAPERADLLQRAYRLGQELGETEQLLPMLRALSSVRIARGEYGAALDGARRLLTLAEETSNHLYAGIGERMVGTAHFFLGDYVRAREHLEEGLRAYRTFTPDTASGRALKADESVRLRVWLAHVLLAMGYPAQAAGVGDEALTRADALGYVGVQGIALTTAGVFFRAACRQPQATLRYARQLLALSAKHALPSYRAWGIFYRGWASARGGQTDQGLEEMRAGLEQLQSTGTRGSLALLLTLMAETYVQIEEISEAATALDRALTLADETGARSNLAGMYRVEGMLHLRRQATQEAEASFKMAIDVAHKQVARLWELRATVSLARLWEAQGRAAEAYARLSEIYAWFTEGMDLPDLAEARALLERLKPPR